MCTISWRFDIAQKSYSVFFNRDEQKLRALAEPPKLFEMHSTKVLMPVDPQGGGSWCAVNQHGFCVALLNFYQGRTPKGRLTSRGQIVRDCARFYALEQIRDYFALRPLAKFAPFSLLAFSPIGNEGPVMFRWDGRHLHEDMQESPLISSALRYEHVNAVRRQAYLSQVKAPDNDDDFIALHKSHLPTRSELSICMHRDDAQTVSFSHIRVDREYVRYAYADGSPCEAPLREFVAIPRVA